MTSLFPTSSPRPKTHISHGTLPGHTSTLQPPTKRSPWRQIQDLPFIQSLSLTLPTSLSTILPPSPLFAQPGYFKLLAPLSSLLTPPFLPLLKTGTILMLSEGTPGVSPYCMRIASGVLTIEMGREVYERAGLQGRVADRNGGARKHGRERWVVQVDLKEPMVGGRKGFERLVRAARGVLGEGKVWVGRDLAEGKDGEWKEREEVLRGMHATFVKGEPEVKGLERVVVPEGVARWKGTTEEGERMSEFEDDYHEVVEWLDLVRMGSPRVRLGDEPDPYISRYQVPDRENGDATDLKVVTWSGLLDREWCTQLLIDLVRRSRRARCREWLAVTINSHRTEALGQIDGCTILFHANQQDDQGVEQTNIDMVAETEGDEAAEEQDEVSPGGFQRFTCFQFVDTVTM